ncbi:hypothetical protein J6590_104777 [Homalodisca vitripennis]|nr:hypothetical protein J6590_104777 [Homalodisca vitripennis]
MSSFPCGICYIGQNQKNLSDETRLMNDQILYNSVKEIDIDQLLPETRLRKKTFILGNFESDDLVLFPTRESATDFRSRLKEKHPEKCVRLKDSCRTIHSFIIHSTQHLKASGTYRRLIVDEALFESDDLVLFPTRESATDFRSRLKEKHPEKYSCRTIHSFIIHSTQHLKASGTYRRLIVDEALMPYAGEIFFAAALAKMSCHCSKAALDKEKHQILVFKQSEKHELKKWGYNCSTIHEFQGKQAAHIAVVRMSKD